MPLKAKVIRFRDQPCDGVLEACFDETGGCVGRRDGCAVLLPDDPSVSRQHGKILYEDGIYKYLDTSSNGTRLENRGQVIRNESAPLNDGDILGIGDYAIMVTIEPRESPPHALPAGDEGIAAPGFPWQPEPMSPKPDELVSDIFRDPQLWPLPATPNESPASAPATANHPSQVFMDPPAGSDPFMELLLGIGSMSDDARDQGCEPVHEAVDTPVGFVPPPVWMRGATDGNLPGTEDVYRYFLQGAGLESSDLARDAQHLEACLEQAGRLLRAFVEGISLALQARADMKRQMRVSVTTIDAHDNNPLKFSSSVDQMLEMMLAMHSQGFKDPVLAVKEGFNDLVNHQLAMSAGIQGSLMSVLKRFDPERIEQAHDQGLGFQRKSKCWEDYRNAYPKLVTGALEDIFGDEFAATYERQLAQLRAAGTNL